MATAGEEIDRETSGGDEKLPTYHDPDRPVYFPPGSIGECEELDRELD